MTMMLVAKVSYNTKILCLRMVAYEYNLLSFNSVTVVVGLPMDYCHTGMSALSGALGGL